MMFKKFCYNNEQNFDGSQVLHEQLDVREKWLFDLKPM